MSRRVLVLLCLLPTVLLLTVSLEAQQPKKVPRIGFLSSSFPSSLAAETGAFREGLRALGYLDGKNILVEYRYAEGALDRLPVLAGELVGLKGRDCRSRGTEKDLTVCLWDYGGRKTGDDRFSCGGVGIGCVLGEFFK